MSKREAGVTAIYRDGTYLENNPLWHQDDSPWKASQILKIINRNQLDPRTVCDVGCGAGEILRRLRESMEDDRQFFGYDISPQAIDICRTKSYPNLQFHLVNLLSDEDAHFDLLLAIDVFEHVENYLEFLRKTREKALYKIFHIPLELSVQWVLRAHPLVKQRKNVGHIHYFTKEIALASLMETGHEVIDYFYTPGATDLPKAGWRTRLLHLPRKLSYALNQDLTVRILGGYSLLVLTK